VINQCMTLLVQELEGEGIPTPLLCEFTLAAVWDDLARLAGETPPPAVRQLFERERPVVVPAMLATPDSAGHQYPVA
jgi:hypothetical protein